MSKSKKIPSQKCGDEIRWSNEDVLKLLEAAQNYRFLYDDKHQDHRDKVLSDKAYEDLSKLFEDSKITAAACKAKLRNCRNTVAGVLRAKKKATGGKRIGVPRWYENAKFLEPHIVSKLSIESSLLGGVSTCPSKNLSIPIEDESPITASNSSGGSLNLFVSADNSQQIVCTAIEDLTSSDLPSSDLPNSSNIAEATPVVPSTARNRSISTSSNEFATPARPRSHTKSRSGSKTGNSTDNAEKDPILNKIAILLDGIPPSQDVCVDPMAIILSDRLALVRPALKFEAFERTLRFINTEYPIKDDAAPTQRTASNTLEMYVEEVLVEQENE